VIQIVWGWMKSYHRRNRTYNYLHLENNLIEMPIKFVKKAARHSYRFTSGYGPFLDYAMKAYSGRRKVLGIASVEVHKLGKK
jgi:hypothetical protein